jgi:hypothetical protein
MLIAANTCIENSDLEYSQPILSKSVASDSQRLKWAIIALTRPNRQDGQKRNRLLVEKLRPYSNKHSISVIFFSEMPFPNRYRTEVINTFLGMAKVKFISTADRGFNMKERYGYKYMCKFFSLDVYDYLKEFDYYMRCDTDCYLNVLNYDILQWAETNNVGYSYALRKLEAHGPTKQTLPTWVDSYIKKCNIVPSAMMDVSLSTCFNFYNNWHIGKVSFFTQPKVRNFLRSVNESGFIISHRWGDSTIQAYAVRLFMPPQNIMQVPNFSYFHGSHGHKLVSTFGDGRLSEVPQRLPNWKYKSDAV